MAVKSYNRKASTKAQVNTHTRQSVKKSERNNSKLWIVFGLIAIIFITYISFTPSLHGTFTNWDDNGYVSENRAVKDLSSENIKHFITGYEMSNYHPVVMITYSLIYHYFKLSPFPYHFFNLFFHILNCLLLFFLIRKLSGKVTVSFIVSFLFALHPLHVESVSWISGTKDVLYTFFLIISLYSYLLYLEKKKFSPYYIYSLVFFILSCVSKAMAVVLPLLLFLIDYLHNRKADFRMFAEKIPFLLISLVMGIVTIYAQKSGNAIGEVTTTSFWQNLLIASHGILFYIYKMLLPYNLSAFYPYPNQVSGTLPFKFLIAPVFVFAIFGLIFWSKKYTKIIIFGFLFYLLNILQVLQILPVGNAIAAERYFYVSSIGLFFICGYAFDWLYTNRKELKIVLPVVFAGLFIYLSSLTYERTKIWKSSLNLWESVLAEYPDYVGAAVAWSNCGNTYQKMGEYDKAFNYFKRAVELDSTYSLALKNLGALYGKTGDYKNSLKYLLKAVKYNKKDEGAYNNLGNVYAIQGNYDKAIEYLNLSININPNDEGAYNNIGNAYMLKKDYDKAIESYTKAIALSPDYPDAYSNLGAVYLNSNQRDKAIINFKKAASLGSDQAKKWLQENKVN